MTHNTIDSSFSYYKPIIEVQLNDLVIENDNKMIINGAMANSPSNYHLIETFPERISWHYNITSADFAFSVKSDTSYPIAFELSTTIH